MVFPGDLVAFSCKGKTDRHTLTPFPWGDHPWNVTHPKFLYRPPQPRSQGLSSSLPPSSRAPGEGKRRGPGNEVAATSAKHRIGLNHLKVRLHNTILSTDFTRSRIVLPHLSIISSSIIVSFRRSHRVKWSKSMEQWNWLVFTRTWFVLKFLSVLLFFSFKEQITHNNTKTFHRS